MNKNGKTVPLIDLRARVEQGMLPTHGQRGDYYRGRVARRSTISETPASKEFRAALGGNMIDVVVMLCDIYSPVGPENAYKAITMGLADTVEVAFTEYSTKMGSGHNQTLYWTLICELAERFASEITQEERDRFSRGLQINDQDKLKGIATVLAAMLEPKDALHLGHFLKDEVKVEPDEMAKDRGMIE